MTAILDALIPGYLLPDTAVNTVRSAASGGGAGTNERLTFKRLLIRNVEPDTGVTVRVTMWIGTASTDAFEELDMDLPAGFVKEYDPTTIILRPGDRIYVQASVASKIKVSGYGLRQME